MRDTIKHILILLFLMGIISDSEVRDDGETRATNKASKQLFNARNGIRK
jgi:hypothetical protein